MAHSPGPRIGWPLATERTQSYAGHTPLLKAYANLLNPSADPHVSPLQRGAADDRTLATAPVEVFAFYLKSFTSGLNVIRQLVHACCSIIPFEKTLHCCVSHKVKIKMMALLQLSCNPLQKRLFLPLRSAALAYPGNFIL